MSMTILDFLREFPYTTCDTIMEYFLIEGGNSLNGDITVSGAKNAALKLLAAALLTSEPCIIRNVPDIADVRSLLAILQGIGAAVAFNKNTVSIHCKTISSTHPDYQLVKHLRASIMVVGPLLARSGEVTIPLPGGCLIGARPIDTHIRALQQLGVSVDRDDDLYAFSAKKLLGNKVVLDEMSVTATENALLAACLAQGETEIHLAASEPEISDLAGFLNSMGAQIDGIGTSLLRVRGQSKLHGSDYTLIPDRIEAGTFAIAAAVSRGKVNIHGVCPDHLDAVLNVLQRANVQYLLEREDNMHSTLCILPTTIFEPISIDTRPYPGFPTDLQAPISVLMTQAKGMGRIFETMYDGRLGYIKELQRMGADAKTVDQHTAVINGPTILYGKRITSFDIRAGATLLIAALIAQGESTLEHIERIDRGYEHIDGRLKELGAHITRHKA